MTRTFSGRGVFLGFVVFFGVIAAVNVLFIVKAVTTFSGEDVDDSYMQGVEYNQTLAKRAIQKEMGWTATIDAARERSGRARVVVTLVSQKGTPLDRLVLKGLLRRPTDSQWDRALTFKEVQPGLYASEARHVAPGVWDVVVDTAAKTPFEADRRLWIP